MVNLDEQNSSGTPSVPLVNTKRTQIFVLVGVIFILSIFLNLFFLFKVDERLGPKKNFVQKEIPQKERTFIEEKIIVNTTTIQSGDLLQQTHTIDKQVSNGGILWLGMKTVQSRDQSTSHSASNYELWRIDGSNSSLIENFTISWCDDVTWDLNSGGGIDLLYSRSPCEAIQVQTHIVYDSEAVEQFRIEYNTGGGGQFEFKQFFKPHYTVSLVTEGVCEGVVPQSPAEPVVPSVMLKGIKLTTFKGDDEVENIFTLPKLEKVSCGVGYGDSITDPLIKEPIFDEEKIEFVLPNKQTAIISLKSSDYAQVRFK